MKFIYVFSGWDGTASDSTMFHNVHFTDLPMLPGKYYLADARFPIRETLLVPYHGVHYHLAEWGCAGLQYVIFDYFWLIKYIVALPIHLNYSTFNMHQHTMSSSVFLVS